MQEPTSDPLPLVSTMDEQFLQQVNPGDVLRIMFRVQQIPFSPLLGRGRRTVTAALRQIGHEKDGHFSLYASSAQPPPRILNVCQWCARLAALSSRTAMRGGVARTRGLR